MKSNLIKLAQKIEEKLKVDPSITVKEHNVKPISYMAFSNLENIINDSKELLEIMNEEDDLPQWVDELLSISKNNISKALDYIRTEKTK